ncbi:hypothetical protein COOONC_12536, partial [Cooperia oncophora]
CARSVSVSPTVCQFALADAEQDEIVSAHARSNSSCAMRFSEYAASRDAAKTLAALVRDFLPAHPEEGLLPLRVFKLTPRERAWIADRAGDFRLYRDNTIRAHRRMTQLFNAACSALVAVNTINDDKRTHMLTATIPSMDLGALPSGAEPLYELISTRQLFHTLQDNVPASDVLDAVYGSLRPDAGPNGPPLENIEAIVGDRVIELRPDQVAALRMTDRRLPVIAKNVRPDSLAIIVFYKEQSRLLEHFAKRTQVDIHTEESATKRRDVSGPNAILDGYSRLPLSPLAQRLFFCHYLRTILDENGMKL